tara:strand:- start:21 stop:1796 length:1776 start_codon:yes stop_codon:yes gene_type:complete
MSKGFGSGSSKKKRNVKKLYLDNQFAEGKKYYLVKNYFKAELIFLNLKNLGYVDPNLFLYLANIYISKGSEEKALKFLKRALEMKPEDPEIYFNLGTIHFKRNEYEISISYYLQGINYDSKNAFAYSNLAGCYEEILDYRNAVDCYKKAFFLNKNLLQIREKLIELQPKICDWSLYDFFDEWRDDFINNTQFEGEPLSFINLKGDPYRELLLSRKYFYSNYQSNKKIVLINKNKKIKIGYISADFRNHPVSLLLARVIELHDKSKFEIYAYSLEREEDEMTIRLKKAFDKFTYIGDLMDNEAINLIRKDNINIAIDLMGYTKNARPNLFAKRVAPKQISFLGYPGTTAGDSIDYLIADKYIIPEKLSKFYSENILYMPNSFLPFDNTTKIDEKEISRKDYRLPEEKFILAAFHRVEKINPKVLDLWSKVLIKLDEAVLWIQEPLPFAKENLLHEFNRRGICEDKIYFAKKTKHLSDHLLRHKLADVFIDTFFYSSHSTGIFALWCGLPVVTLKGLNFASRVVPSLLKNLSLSELIANDDKEYIRIISKLYEQRELLKKFKDKLGIQKEKNKIYNSEFFVRDLEKLYLSIKD